MSVHIKNERQEFAGGDLTVHEIPYLVVKNLRKVYGATIAVNDVSFDVDRGEIVGLVGPNGAGKSTVMRIISGVTRPDAGDIYLNGELINRNIYGPVLAKKHGIRVVHQELSLYTNLTVYENFFLEEPVLFKGFFNWREQAQSFARGKLEEVFPGNDIDVCNEVGKLSVSQQQMIEIAKAAGGMGLKILILDEPTSSLAVEQTEQLLHYLKRLKNGGVSCIFISHRLREVVSVTDRIIIMQNGSLKWSGLAAQTNEENVVEIMTGESTVRVRQEQGLHFEQEEAEHVSLREFQKRNEVCVNLKDVTSEKLKNINFSCNGGEIIGLAGLVDNGQRELLRLIFNPLDRGMKGYVERRGRIAYVTGDRKKEGIFPLWSIKGNVEITKVVESGAFHFIQDKSLENEALNWFKKLNIVGVNVNFPIVSLSGGNQQKVLIARALMADSDIILLDDPTRGVDVATKKQLYEIFREAASAGKLIVWYSSDDDEFVYCSRVIVMRDGLIIKELAGRDNTKDNIIKFSFSHIEKEEKLEEQKGKRVSKHPFFSSIAIPLITMLALLFIIGALSPNVFTPFGIDLLVGGAMPLIFASIAQTFIIGLSNIDLGIGAFVGLASVVSATILPNNVFLGTLVLMLLLAIYPGMGTLICLRNIPPIVVTLGASFIWTGLSYTLLPQPGGEAPAWLLDVFNINIVGIPFSILIVTFGAILAYVIYRSRWGTVLRAFGNNPLAAIQSGWSKVKTYILSYFISGIFCLIGGLAMTAITTAADPNAASSYTLLTVASTVMGGALLVGGVINPIGTVFGAITLSLLGTLLGFLKVSSNYVPAAQGFILLTILALRLLRRSRNND